MGIVVGATTSLIVNPRLVLGAGLGASMAMAISGFFGAYMTERAERARTLRRLKRAMLHSLDRSIHVRAMKIAAFWTALVVAFSPAFAALLSMMPIYLAVCGILEVKSAVLLSVSIILSTLFFLGAFLGKISQESLILSGVRTLALGILTALISLTLGFF